MTRITVQSRTGPDGTLRLDLPLGKELADRDVSITIEPDSSVPQQEHLEFLRTTAGAWQGDFERPAPNCPEERDTL
ncbi:MAG TPA: hypothetical protein VF278_15050 [Pirellulales bacterium]